MKLNIFTTICSVFVCFALIMGFGPAQRAEAATTAKAPSIATKVPSVVPTYIQPVFINYSNGYVFTGFVLESGTECVAIERDSGSLAAFHTVSCNFSNIPWFPRKPKVR